MMGASLRGAFSPLMVIQWKPAAKRFMRTCGAIPGERRAHQRMPGGLALRRGERGGVRPSVGVDGREGVLLAMRGRTARWTLRNRTRREQKGKEAISRAGRAPLKQSAARQRVGEGERGGRRPRKRRSGGRAHAAPAVVRKGAVELGWAESGRFRLCSGTTRGDSSSVNCRRSGPRFGTPHTLGHDGALSWLAALSILAIYARAFLDVPPRARKTACVVPRGEKSHPHLLPGGPARDGDL